MLNNVCLIGRLTDTPELKQTTNYISVCSFTIAVQRSYTSENDERQCDFIDIVTWKKTAEFVVKYFTKGSMIALEGTIQTRNYTDKSDNKRKAVEIVADKIHFIEKKKGDTNNDENNFVEVSGDEELPF